VGGARRLAGAVQSSDRPPPIPDPALAWRPRVAILKDAFIPEYRLRLYERLGEISEVEYTVFHGDPPAASGHQAATGPFAFPEVRLGSREMGFGGKALVYQPALRRIAGPGFDAAVIGAELKLLANFALFPLLKLRRRPVLLWGQAIEKQEDRGAAMQALYRGGGVLRAAAARRADGYLAYTAGGRRRLIEQGVDSGRVFVLRNTLDMEAEIELHRAVAGEDEAALRERLGLKPESLVLLFVGRVYREKRLSELVALLRRLQAGGGVEVEGLVLGDGPDLARVMAAAEGLDCVRFLGEVRDRECVARCMKVAAALVIPGAAGLAVNHAFAHGLPVITQASPLHGPEFEYVESGRNGLIAAPGAEALFEQVAAFVASPAQRRALAAGALSSRETLTVAAMAASFDAAVRATLATAGHTSNLRPER
jgi:glycosyltransferase involved in cell wall biosynthesis